MTDLAKSIKGLLMYIGNNNQMTTMKADLCFLCVSAEIHGSLVRNFRNKIPCPLRASYVHVFDSCFLHVNELCNVRLSESYFIAKWKTFPRCIAYCVRFANVSVLLTSR